MSDKLKALIEKARNNQMSADEMLEQEINFAYGDAHFGNERITREMVANALPAATQLPSGKKSELPVK
jgi:hypothetical protein